jgi:predicted O-methyltransferase YrrM
LQDSAVVEATCVDRDAEAIEYGESLALHKGLAGCVHYVRGDVFSAGLLPPGQDVAVLSGLLDYLDLGAAVSILTRVRERLAPGGVVLLANMRHHGMASAMSMLGNWHLVYREPCEVERLLVESGYGGIKVWLESEKVFCIAKGRRPGVREAARA